MSIIDIPYEDRIEPLPGGFALIWPFRNCPKGPGPYELFLDNNALARSDWLNELKPNLRDRVILNPMLAWAEQWLSNPLFRANAEGRVTEFIDPFVEAGIRFPADYARTQARSLAANDTAWRSQWMLAYLYVVLLYRITKARKGDDVPEKLLTGLKDQDVPMFNGCIMLCCLASYLRSNQAMRLVDDGNAAYSYLNSFISLHGSGKGESEFDENYIRNRAGDLFVWYALGWLFQNGFQPAGEPVLVTQDKALTKLILRCFPGYLDPSGRMMFTPDERPFEARHASALVERIKATVGFPRATVDRTAKLNRMDTLRSYVKQGADAQLSDAVDRVWESWLTPGFQATFR
jgi:hypothetical protein